MVTDQSPSRVRLYKHARMNLPDAISMEPFQQYLAEMFPEDGKRSTSGVVHELDSTVNAC